MAILGSVEPCVRFLSARGISARVVIAGLFSGSVAYQSRVAGKLQENLAMSQFAFGARVSDPQQRDLPGDVLRLTEPRSANWDTAENFCAAHCGRFCIGDVLSLAPGFSRVPATENSFQPLQRFPRCAKPLKRLSSR